MTKIFDRVFNNVIGSSRFKQTSHNFYSTQGAIYRDREFGVLKINFNKNDKIKMCKDCSAFCYNNLWHDEAPKDFVARLHKDSVIELTKCPMCIYLHYRKECIICNSSKKETLCPSCQYLYYKANNSIGVLSPSYN